MLSTFQRHNLILAFCHMMIGIPSIYFMLGLPLILAMQGFPASTIGLFQLVGLPAMFKLIWSLPIDRIRFERDHYKKWALGVLVMYLLFLLLIAQLSLDDDFYLVLVAVAFASFFASVADIPVTALAIKIFTPEQRQQVGGYKSAALFTAFIFGGGFLLMVYNHWGWQAPLYIMATLIAIGTLLLLLVNESEAKTDQKTVEEELKNQRIKLSFKLIFDFFRQPNAGKWSLLLLVYFGLISVAWVYIKPLLLHQGFDADHVALSVGVVGGGIGALISLNSHHLANWFSKRALLWQTSLLNAVAVGYTALLVAWQAPLAAYYLSIVLVSVGVGLSSSLMLALMMDYARKPTRAIDHGIQTSVMTLARILFPALSGVVIGLIEYQGLFAVLAIGLVMVTWISFKLKDALVKTSM